VYLCVLCGCQNKQRLFLYTALTDWFCNRDGECLLRGASWVFKYDSGSFCSLKISMERLWNSLSVTTKTSGRILGPPKTQCSVKHRGALDRTLLSFVCLWRVTNVGNSTNCPTESPSACLLSLSTTLFAWINSRTKWTNFSGL